MSAPLPNVAAPERDPAESFVRPELDRAAAELALDMMGRAFEALAMLYELRHLGEYAAQAGKLKEYVADNLRHAEKALGDELDPATFRGAVLRVRDLFEKVDDEVAAMFLTDATAVAGICPPRHRGSRSSRPPSEPFCIPYRFTPPVK